MSLNIVPSTSEERKQLFAEILLGKTNKINKISDNSVVSGVSYGVGKVSGKAEKDIVLALGKLFPDTAFGTQLDQVAQDYGVSFRFDASQSSTYIRVVADPGTQYTAGVHVFRSTEGIEFDIEKTTVIGTFGYSYIKVRSIDSGNKTNVKPGSISLVTPIPSGHRFCVNEYRSSGGRDIEDDLIFRQRIKDGPNILARGTIATIEQVFMLINSNVLSVRYQGINSFGQLKLVVTTQNGIDLSKGEITTLLTKSEEFLGLSELRPFGRKSYGVEIVNMDWQPFDISFRGVLLDSANVDDVRISIQTRIAKYIDFRFFESGITKVEWDNLLSIVKNTKGMKYVPDEFFYPNIDIPTDSNKLPRLRGFLMLDLNGAVINNLQGSFNPVFYPNVADFSFAQTMLRTI